MAVVLKRQTVIQKQREDAKVFRIGRGDVRATPFSAIRNIRFIYLKHCTCVSVK